MRLTLKRCVVAIGVGLILAATSAHAGVRVVNCDEGDSLQKALDAGAGSAAPIEIFVTGTCYEDPRIRRDRVSINGDESTIIDGRIRVFGDQLTIRDLKVKDGISFRHSRARLFDVQIVDNDDGFGMLVASNSSVSCDSCTISGNQEGIRIEASHVALLDTDVDFNDTAGEYSDGILVLQNSSLTSEGGSISNNGNLGIRVNWNSSIVVRETQIQSNGAYGIQMFNASGGDLSDVQVSDNEGFGIELGGNSALEMYRGEVRGNGWDGIRVSEHSMLRLHDTTITQNVGHGIDISRDGGVATHGVTKVFGNGLYFQVICTGDEASIDVADESTVEPFECSGF